MLWGPKSSQRVGNLVGTSSKENKRYQPGLCTVRFKYHPGLCLASASPAGLEPLQGASPALSASLAGLSAPIWAAKKTKGFARLAELDVRKKKPSQAAQITSHELAALKPPGLFHAQSGEHEEQEAGSDGQGRRSAVIPLEFQPPGCSLKQNKTKKNAPSFLPRVSAACGEALHAAPWGSYLICLLLTGISESQPYLVWSPPLAPELCEAPGLPSPAPGQSSGGPGQGGHGFYARKQAFGRSDPKCLPKPGAEKHGSCVSSIFLSLLPSSP